jgi:hypothetical protein
MMRPTTPESLPTAASVCALLTSLARSLSGANAPASTQPNHIKVRRRVSLNRRPAEEVQSRGRSSIADARRGQAEELQRAACANEL